MTTISVTQYQLSDPVALSVDDLRRLVSDYGTKVGVRPEPGGGLRIAPAEYVGVIRLDEHDILIQPKIPPLSVFWMLGYAERIARFEPIDFPFAAEQGMLSILARLFANETALLIRRGLFREYVEREENLTLFRGRLATLPDIRANLGLRHRAYCRYSELTSDVRLNQILWFATEILGRLTLHSKTLQHQLAWNHLHLSAVTPTHVTPRDLEGVTYGRLNDHYRPAIRLAALVIENLVYRLESGARRGPGFLLDMDRVYQEFLTRVIAKAAEGFGLHLRTPGGLHLDQLRRVFIDPDVVLVDAGGAVRVALDAKYKRHDPTSDVYQALAYAKGLGLRTVALVYPEDGEVSPATHEIRNDDTMVFVRTIPVGRGALGFRELDRRTDDVAKQILAELVATEPLIRVA